MPEKKGRQRCFMPDKFKVLKIQLRPVLNSEKYLFFNLDPILFLMTPMLQTSDLERSDRYCHYKSDNYIIIPKMRRYEK